MNTQQQTPPQTQPQNQQQSRTANLRESLSKESNLEFNEEYRRYPIEQVKETLKRTVSYPLMILDINTQETLSVVKGILQRDEEAGIKCDIYYALGKTAHFITKTEVSHTKYSLLKSLGVKMKYILEKGKEIELNDGYFYSPESLNPIISDMFTKHNQSDSNIERLKILKELDLSQTTASNKKETNLERILNQTQDTTQSQQETIQTKPESQQLKPENQQPQQDNQQTQQDLFTVPNIQKATW